MKIPISNHNGSQKDFPNIVERKIFVFLYTLSKVVYLSSKKRETLRRIVMGPIEGLRKVP